MKGIQTRLFCYPQALLSENRACQIRPCVDCKTVRQGVFSVFKYAQTVRQMVLSEKQKMKSETEKRRRFARERVLRYALN